jgi:hypothetical protein
MAAIVKRWEVVPPLSVSIAGIAAALGVKRPEKAAAQQGNMEELAGMLGTTLGQGKPEWLTKTE